MCGRVHRCAGGCWGVLGTAEDAGRCRGVCVCGRVMRRCAEGYKGLLGLWRHTGG